MESYFSERQTEQFSWIIVSISTDKLKQKEALLTLSKVSIWEESMFAHKCILNIRPPFFFKKKNQIIKIIEVHVWDLLPDAQLG